MLSCPDFPGWESCELEIRIWSRTTGQLHLRLHLDRHVCGPTMAKGTGPAITWPSAYCGAIVRVLKELITQRSYMKCARCTINRNGMGF